MTLEDRWEQYILSKVESDFNMEPRLTEKDYQNYKDLIRKALTSLAIDFDRDEVRPEFLTDISDTIEEKGLPFELNGDCLSINGKEYKLMSMELVELERLSNELKNL